MTHPYHRKNSRKSPPSVSRSPPSVDIYLPNLPVGNYLRVQQLAVKYVSPSRQDLNLKVILEPPVQTCCECHVTERCIQGILYFILMRYNRDGGICNIRSWNAVDAAKLEPGSIAAVFQMKKSGQRHQECRFPQCFHQWELLPIEASYGTLPSPTSRMHIGWFSRIERKIWLL